MTNNDHIRELIRNMYPTFHACPMIDIVILIIKEHWLADKSMSTQTVNHLEDMLEAIRHISGENRVAKQNVCEILEMAIDDNIRPTHYQMKRIHDRCMDEKPKHKYIKFHEKFDVARPMGVEAKNEALNEIMKKFHARKKGDPK